jgi:hypothetical protein
VTFEEKKQRLDIAKMMITLPYSKREEMDVWLCEELEKAWAALEFYADSENAIVLQEKFKDQRDTDHLCFAQTLRARKALGDE